MRHETLQQVGNSSYIKRMLLLVLVKGKLFITFLGVLHTGSLLIIVNGSNNFYRTRPSYRYFAYSEPVERRWVRIPQPRSTNAEDVESGRHFGPETLSAISETLGAINTVGRYIINMTRGGEDTDLPDDVPGAIYTISKNVLGRNVTDTIKPLVSPLVSPLVRETHSTSYQQKPQTTDESENYPRTCTTPDGTNGYCDDLSDCPQLLLNLSNLRQSLCFKSIFVPGVCCPRPVGHVVPVPKPITTTPPTTTTISAVAKTSPTIPAPIVSSTAAPISAFVGSIVDPEDCGQPETANFRVVGGEESLPGRWPWMAAIFLHGNRRTEFWCGGALITAKHVLTAAHCTKDSQQRPFAARQFTVRLGDIDLKREDEPSAPVTYKVTEVRAHHKFSRVGFYNDIAILVLDRLVRKSKYVIPLCLPPPQLRNEKFAGQRTTVVGWGTTYYGGKESTTQRQAVLPIWRNEDCDDAYFQPITSNFICAGYSHGGTDACQGDSGGPLMIYWDTRWIQVGVVSFGNKCGEPGYPGVYTRVTEYLNWIKDHTKDR
ncbi:proclotting enzyme-like isoform X1 [Photinus pyralis]|uniref:proclotting enzyme-like isoform X1 n=1 Tax=Photinus pyralis TaxID=7054 RepID=UPI0012671AF6|nr:proclotting enzyme-like isoform X1 [Photinus pyralis]